MSLLEVEESQAGFARLVGMERAIELCKRLLGPTSGVQTVLLYGVDDAAKFELAFELAKGWLCRDPQPNGGCGKCDACGRTARSSQPDLLTISPSAPSNLIRITAVDGDPDTGQVGIKQFIQMMPIGSRFKVIIIDKANRMNAATANALLKTLEEPPEYVKIVMTAPAPSSVLPTIASRCLCVACALPDQDQLSSSFDDLQITFSLGSPEKANLVQKHRALYEGIYNLAMKLPTAGPADVLEFTTQLRQLAESWTSPERQSRQALADCLEALAVAAKSTFPGAIPAIVEAHRRIIGNGSASLVVTAMFASILAPREG